MTNAAVSPNTGTRRGALASVFVVLAVAAFLALYFRPTSHPAEAASTGKLAAMQAQVLKAAEQQRSIVARSQLQFIVDKAKEVLAATSDLNIELTS